jgi:hypothetical protein
VLEDGGAALDAYHDGDSLANALLHSPRPTILQSQSHQVQFATKSPTSNTPITLHSPYPAMQHMQPPPQPRMLYNGLYHNADGSDSSDMRRQTEEMIHFEARGVGSGSL